ELASGLPVVFHFAGSGRDLPRVRQWAANRNNVKIHGFMENISPLLCSMFAAMTFSPSEGFPNMVLQAMSIGLPVLALENESIPEIITPGQTGFIFHHGEEALSQIRLLLEDRLLATKTGKFASDSVRSRFSRDEMVRRTIELYKEILP